MLGLRESLFPPPSFCRVIRNLLTSLCSPAPLCPRIHFRFRINYIYRPGDDMFLIYNEGRSVDELESGLLGRSIMLKWTYSFAF